MSGPLAVTESGHCDEPVHSLQGGRAILQIRLMKEEDLEAIVQVWHTSGRKAYTFIDSWQRFTFDQARSVFRQQIASVCEVWVAEAEDTIVGYLALKGSYVDRLYVSLLHQMWNTIGGLVLRTERRISLCKSTAWHMLSSL
jgi:hypothetical protein